MIPRRARAGALAAAMLVGLVPAGVALADFNADSKVTINSGGGAFFGAVKSKRAFCEANRLIRLFKARRHRRDLVVATDSTNDNGLWRIPKPSSKGRFYAGVEVKEERDYGEVRRCRSDTSRTIRA
jgi:hypothetical protein